MKTTIYLVRHGNSTGNVKKQVIGVTDVHLTKEGFNQGKLVAKHFKNKKLDAVYSSNLSRAEITATFTAKQKKLPLFIDWRFGELNFGETYEGLTWEEALKIEDGSYVRYREKDGFLSVKFPRGGESGKEALERMIAALIEVAKKHEGGRVMIVSHSVVMMILMAYLDNGNSVNGVQRQARVPNASITTLEIEDDKITLLEKGYVGHLRGITI